MADAKQQALRRAKTATNHRHRAVYDYTQAILFFGTPHRGGSYTDLGLTVRKMVASAGFDANDRVLRDLKFDSSTAKLLREEFVKMLDDKRPAIYTFQEALGLTAFGPLSGKVVEDSSSALDCANEQKDFIRANHAGMCRFPNAEDEGYEKVKHALSACLLDDNKLVQSVPIQSVPEQGVKTSVDWRTKILRHLNRLEIDERFNKVDEAYRTTYEWIYQNSELGFIKWLTTGDGIFFISGKPGSGKSTLMKFIYSDPRTSQHLGANNSQRRWVTARFFFSDRGTILQKSIGGLTISLLYQILHQVPELVQVCDLDDNLKSYRIAPSIIEKAWLRLLTFPKLSISICLFIDALDEEGKTYSHDHAELLDTLKRWMNYTEKGGNKLLLCLSSRPEPHFMELIGACPGLRIDEYTKHDITTYVHSRLAEYLQTRKDLTRTSDNTAILRDIEDEIIRRAQGVFLWVRLIVTDLINTLIDGGSPTELLRLLSTIPGDGDLHALYRNMFSKFKDKYRDEAYLMLQIVFATLSPLSAPVFFQCIKFTLEGPLEFEQSSPTIDQMQRRLMSRCKGLLEIQGKTDKDAVDEAKKDQYTVQFLHQSVKDFLAQENAFATITPNTDKLQDGHTSLVKFYISKHLYQLRATVFETSNTKVFNETVLDKMIQKRYTTLHPNSIMMDVNLIWYYARLLDGKKDVSVIQALDTFADFVDSNELADLYVDTDERWPIHWHPSFLGLSVMAGLLSYTSHLLQRRAIADFHGQPLLHYAVAPSHPQWDSPNTVPFAREPEMLRLLVGKGVNIEEEFDGLTAFGLGVIGLLKNIDYLTSLQMLETLLELGASPDVLVQQTYAGSGRRAWAPELHAIQAALYESKDLTSLLLKHNARTDLLKRTNWEALEQRTPTIKLLTRFREGSLCVEDLDFFAGAFRVLPSSYLNHGERERVFGDLLKRYPSGELAVRQGNM